MLRFKSHIAVSPQRDRPPTPSLAAEADAEGVRRLDAEPEPEWRYQDETIAQSIFDRIVEQAIKAGLVDGTVLYTDSTHLKANANKNRFDLG